MMVAGIGLTATGAAGLAVTTGVSVDIASGSQHRRTTKAAHLMPTLALGLPSAGLVAAGVSLWVKGAKTVEPRASKATSESPDLLVPAVQMAPGSVDLIWSF